MWVHPVNRHMFVRTGSCSRHGSTETLCLFGWVYACVVDGTSKRRGVRVSGIYFRNTTKDTEKQVDRQWALGHIVLRVGMHSHDHA